jgi:hypothetical protein
VAGADVFSLASFNSACGFDEELYQIEVTQKDDSLHVASCYATWDWDVGYKQTRCDDRDVPTVDAADATALCQEGEVVVFSCATTRSAGADADHPRSIARKIISVCAAPQLSIFVGPLTYRFGAGRQHLELEYPTPERAPGEVFTSRFSSSRSELSFKKGAFSYTVYHDIGAARGSGAGVRVSRDGRVLTDLWCDGKERSLDIQDNMRAVIEPLGFPETPGKAP